MTDKGGSKKKIMEKKKSSEEKHSEKKHSTKKNQFLKKLSKNNWAIASFVLAIALIVSIAVGPKTCGAAIVTPEVAGDKVMEFAANQGVDAELISVGEAYSLYEVVLSIEDQEVPIYITMDGNTLVPQPYPLNVEEEETTTTTTSTAAETTAIPTSDTPLAELFIWAYCPYGVTALTPFAEVAKLLGDSSTFKVNTYYAGHGDFELQQNKIQSCIQDLGYTTEYWDYAIGFAGTIYEECYGDIECDLEESTALMDSLGIDSTAVLTCVEEKGEALYEEAYNRAKELGVTGSPTLTINGVKASVSRTAEAYKTAICSSYTSAPEDCKETLSSTAATTTGSC